MSRINLRITLMTMLFLCMSFVSKAGGTFVYDLKAEYLSEPQSLGITDPALSWKIESRHNNVYQKSYRILAATVVSDYRKTCYYSTYDVTDHLKEGGSSVGAVLGGGRFVSMGKPMMREKKCAAASIKKIKGVKAVQGASGNTEYIFPSGKYTINSII